MTDETPEHWWQDKGGEFVQPDSVDFVSDEVEMATRWYWANVTRCDITASLVLDRMQWRFHFDRAHSHNAYYVSLDLYFFQWAVNIEGSGIQRRGWLNQLFSKKDYSHE